MRTSTVFILSAVLLASAVFAEDAADILLVNGRVYTLEEERPWAEALAIKGNRLVAVGTNEEARRWKGAGTREIDVDGAFVSPGFNDAHVHVDGTGALLTGVNLLDVHTADAFRERIRETTARLPKGSWITRGMWGAYEQWGAGSSGEAPTGPRADGPFTPTAI
jgi:hypothetical protein